MPTKAFIAAAITAAVGALAWALVAYYTNYEIGYLAIAVGFGVGAVAKASGGRGESAALTAAALAAAAILCGKLVTASFFQSDFSKEIAAISLDQPTYEAMMEESKAAQSLTPDSDWRPFMVDYGYTEAGSPNEVSPEEVETFKAEAMPAILESAKNPPSYEQAKADFDAEVKRFADEMMSNTSTWEMVKGNLGLIDVVFFVLGVGAAYSAARNEED